ncbi:MAG: hypothetical protein PUE55_07585 [Bacteroidales bacterium]|nr:hypothetical protein [Bacteroidales bacterium]
MQILKKLQTLLPLQHVVAIIVAGLLWFLPDMFGTRHAQSAYAFVVLGQYQWFALPALWAHIVQYLCWTAIVYWITLMCEHYRILPMRSALPVIILLTAGAANSRWQFFDASTVAFVGLLLTLSQLLSMYEQKRECIAQTFNCGLFIMCAVLFDFDYVWLIPLVLFGFILFGALTARTFCTFLAGIFMPLFLVAGCFVLADRLPELIAGIPIPTLFDTHRLMAPRSSEVAFAGILCMVFACSLICRLVSGTIFSLHTRLNYIFITCSLFYTLAVAVIFMRFDALLLVPFTFLLLIICFYFATNTTTKCANILFWIFLTAVVVCRTLFAFGF